MKTKNAGERKRTVTIVVGPATIELMDRLNAILAERLPWTSGQSLTGLAGAALNACLSEWRAAELNDGPKKRWSHFD